MSAPTPETGAVRLILGGTVAALALAVIISAAGKGTPASTNQTGASPATAPAAPVGLPTVFAEIAADTSCTSLQTTFDRADATSKRSGTVPDGPAFEGARGRRWSEVGTAYMKAADDRMRAVGCY